jgi:protease IV
MLQKFYQKVNGSLPFKNATENSYWRVKAMGAAIGVGMVAAFFLAEIGLIGAAANKYGLLPHFSSGKPQVALIDLSGEITVDTANDLISKMEELRDDENVKSVLIRINSGGGSPAGSDDIANYLLDFQKDKKVRVYVQGIAASGAYYIASSVKPLVANPNAIIGSIGVILPHYTVGEAAKKFGIEEDNIVAGKYKVPVSMFAKVDKDSKAYLSSNLLQPTYTNFKKFVALNRGVGLKRVEQVADGKIYVASMPEVQGILVDRLSSFQQIAREAKKECGENCEIEPIDFNKNDKAGLFGIKVDVSGLEPLVSTSLKL